MPAWALRCDRSAHRSWSSREIPFSLAMRSAAWPIDSPVEYSAIAGATGTRSRGRSRAKALRRAPSVFAREAATSVFDSRSEARIGMRDRHSAPPATTMSAHPASMRFAPSAIAWLAEAQARETVTAGTSFGSADSPTSRAMFGACGSCSTVP